MTSRAFEPWVEPIAAELRKSRSEIAAFARCAPADFWAKASPNPGWSNKDLLAHLATGHWVVQANLRALLSAQEFRRFSGPDAGNAERVEERRGQTVEELAVEAEAEGEETEDLLARLTEAHESFRREGAPRTLGEGLRAFTNHDPFHLDQLRGGLEGMTNV